MSLLFDHSRSCNISISVKQHSGQGGPDVALLSKQVWNSLLGAQSPSDRVGFAVTPTNLPTPSPSQKLKSLVFWAIPEDQEAELAVPAHWLEDYRNVFSALPITRTQPHARYHTLSRVTPTPLAELFFSALSPDAFSAANTADSFLERWTFSDSLIIRQGSVYAFDRDLRFIEDPCNVTGVYRYEVALTSPVLQGYAKLGVTRFFLASAPSARGATATTSLTHDIHRHRHGERDTPQDDLVDSELEIDELFLAGSVLRPVSQPSVFATEKSGSDDAVDPDQWSMDSNSILQAQPLLYPISLASDDFTVYVSTTDLGKVGVLNGDWAVVRSCSGFRSRFVRVFANDELVTQAGVLIASPILVHNIHGSATTSSQSVLVALRASPFGSRPPPIRTARTLTIARVASPCTIDRAYQPIFLNALKGYFDGRRRLIKQGDLLALAIDTDHIASPSESIGESVELEANRIEAPETFDSTLIPNEMVCFRVTNVESDEGDIRASTDCSNLHSGFIDGEYGCWSDSSLTRMVQSGVEYSLVPDAARYLGLERTLPISSIAQKLLASNALADETPSSKLFAITAAALMPKASTFDIHLSVLLKGVAGVGKFTAARLIGQHLGLHILEINCYHLLGENDTKSEGTLRARFEKAKSCSPCILILRHVDALAQTSQAPEPGKEPMLSSSLRDCIDDLENTWKFNGHPVFIYGTTCDATKMSSTILSCFKHEVTFQVPSEIERLDILSSLLLDVPTSPDVSPSMVARQTAALVAGDIVDLVARAKYASIERVVQSTSSNLSKADVSHAGVPLSALDFDVGLAQARAAYSESIGAPKIPSVSWEDVGGLAHVKSEILDTIQLPLEHPELFASGLKKRSGILLYGPPGTGKTLLAKAVATSCSLNFFSVKGPELLNMYIGESEANVRRVFQRARDAKPCVIFFDELDSVAPKRGSHGDSGGVMDRIVSQLLAELDGMSTGKGSADVFVIGATNRPDLLDPALLRPGRFDRLLYLGVSDTHQAQLNILSALTRKFRLHPSLDLLLVAKQCPFNYTGADFYALCSDALLNAMSRKALELDDIIAGLNQSHSLPGHPYPLTPQYYLSEVASPQEIEVLVLQEDFDSALRNLTPSVSQHEMEHYGRIQARFSQNLRDGTE